MAAGTGRIVGGLALAGITLGLLAAEARAADRPEVIAGPLPTLRIRLGAAAHLTQLAQPEQPAQPPQPELARGAADFALDLAAGYPFFWRSETSARLVGLYPELSYTYQVSERHLFTAGGYVGLGTFNVLGSYGARFVAGTDHGQAALGVRHGLGLHLLLDMLSLEVAHQPLWIGGQVQHDLLVFVGLNPLQLVNRLVGLQFRLS